MTKEQLLQALEAADREGKVVSINTDPELSDDMDEEELSQGARRRSAGRKGTAFVPNATAEAASPLDEVDANQVSPGWLCCGGAGR